MDLLTSIDRGEALRYLGYHGTEIDSQTEGLLRDCMEETLRVFRPRYTYRYFNLGQNGQLENTLFALQGEDILRHLEGCHRCVLMAVTLGTELETSIRAAQIMQLARAVVLDSCASAAVEQVCDAVQDLIAKEAAPDYLTARFSPGYGDMPIGQQQDFVRLLDTARQIGLSVTPNNILLPRKSVTAVLGLSKTSPKHTKTGCGTCRLRETCSFRKEGKTCENR